MSASIYTLNVNIKDGTEQHRLNEQYQELALLTKHEGLLPEHVRNFLLQVSSEHAPAVADIGTGTGIWLQDLATKLPPQARLDGYDIDVSKFPNTSTLPPNVKLLFGDGFAPFPAELHAQYDCVHIRLMTCALKATQWEELAANVRALLRPGGWLVWEDTGYSGFTCLPMTENYQKWINMGVRFTASVGRDITAPFHLLGQVKDQGYVNCTEKIFNFLGTPEEVQKTAGELTAAFASQSMHGIVDRGGFDWLKTHEQADEMARALRADHANGCKFGFQLHRIVGQNPQK